MTIFGPRALIVKVGACEPLGDDHWWISGWELRCHHTPCVKMWTYDSEGRPLALMGWPLTELQAISRAEFDLADLPTT